MKIGGGGVKGAAEGAAPRAGAEIERKMSWIGREFRRREKANKGKVDVTERRRRGRGRGRPEEPE